MIPVKWITQDILTTRDRITKLSVISRTARDGLREQSPIANQYPFHHPEARISHETIPILSAYLFSLLLPVHTLRRGARKRSAQDRPKRESSARHGNHRQAGREI
jgi:hypothetical protein